MRTLALLSALSIGGVFLADAITPQALVVAILYNVPIALTALAFSPRLTMAMTLFALLANVGAGILNARQGVG